MAASPVAWWTTAPGAISLAGLAQALRGRPLRHRVRLLFSDHEESGLLGSKSYLAARKPGEIAAAVNLDILGYGDSLLFGGGKAAGSDAVVQALHQMCADRRLACLEFCVHFPAGRRPQLRGSGHRQRLVAFLPAADAHSSGCSQRRQGAGAAGGLPAVAS